MISIDEERDRGRARGDIYNSKTHGECKREKYMRERERERERARESDREIQRDRERDRDR